MPRLCKTVRFVKNPANPGRVNSEILKTCPAKQGRKPSQLTLKIVTSWMPTITVLMTRKHNMMFTKVVTVAL